MGILMVSFVRDDTTSERSRTLARGPRISQWLIQGPWVLISAVARDPVGVAYLHSNHSALTIHNLYELHPPKKLHKLLAESYTISMQKHT